MEKPVELRNEMIYNLSAGLEKIKYGNMNNP